MAYRSFLTKGLVGLMTAACFDIGEAETLKKIVEEFIAKKSYVFNLPHVHQEDYFGEVVPSTASPLSASGSIQSVRQRNVWHS